MSIDTTPTTMPTWALGAVRAKHARLAKIAAKLGVEAPGLIVSEPYQGLIPARFLTSREQDMIQVGGPSFAPRGALVDVTETGTTPVLPGGWAVLATVEHHASPEGGALNIVSASPRGRDLGLAESLRHADNTCDHCGFDRNRTRTIVLANEAGEQTRVGSTCLRDFLGFHGASLDALWTLMREAGEDTGDEAFAGARQDNDPFVGVLTIAVAAVRQHGFTSAQAEYGYATKARVLDHCYGTAKFRADADVNPTEADAVEAQAITAWLLTNDEASDYMVNLHTLATLGYVPRKRYGLVCSAPQAWLRHQGKVAERAARDEAQANAGPAPRGKVTVTGTVVSTKINDGQYGLTYKMMVLLANGARVWGTVPRSILPDGRLDALIGASVTFTATFDPKAEDPTFAWYNRPTKASVTTPGTGPLKVTTA